VREETLKGFFVGVVEPRDLAADLEGSLVPDGPRVTYHPIADMNEDFWVTPDHLIRVCDAVLKRSIRPELLEAIGFCLVASDHFKWNDETEEGKRVDDTAHDWAAPQINYPLTRRNVRQFRRRLETGEAVE
jgi:hypothetical protein